MLRNFKSHCGKLPTRIRRKFRNEKLRQRNEMRAPYPMRGRVPAVLSVSNLSERNGSVVVAVSVVWMMQMTVHQVVHMVAMRNSLMTTARTMNVICIVTATFVVWCATCRVGL